MKVCFGGSLVLKTKVSKITSGVMRRHEGLSLEPGSLGIDPNCPQANVIGASLIQYK